MTPLEVAGVVGIVTILLLATGIPIAFGLGIVSILFLVIFEGFGSLNFLGEIFFAGLSEFTLVSIPMFIVMGAAIAASPAGRDLYEALDRWLYRVPGGLVMSNLGACSIFAALSGSSPATCAAIGKMGIPEMRQRGYPDGLATGAIAAGGTLGILIPPSVTMIVYGVATETSIGRLFIAGLLPGFMLSVMFMAWAIFYAWRERLQLRGSGGRLQPARQAHPAAAGAAVSGDHRRHPVRPLRRRGHALGGGRRRRHVLPVAGGGHLQDVAARNTSGGCSARACARAS